MSVLPRFSREDNIERLPSNGIYVVFETDELAHGTDRIVRVGTHTGSGNLVKRIKEHLFTPNKDRSIFRKHIGRCLLNRGSDPFLKFWNISMTERANRERYAASIDENKQTKVEESVSTHINTRMQLAVFEVSDKATRMGLEKKLIATIAQCQNCAPSSNWLGLHHPKEIIPQCGLWNVQHVKDEPFSEAEAAQFILQFI